MSSQTNIMDKDQLINEYVQEVIDGMDLKDCLAVLHDFMTDSYKDYTIEEIKEEVEEYRKIDPITQVKDIIIQNNYASDVEILDMDNRVKQRVLECQKFAEESPFPEINVMYDAVYEQENYPFLKHKL